MVESSAGGQFEQALTLLHSTAAPSDGARAIDMIEAAAGEGNAQAIAMCALFEAMGAARPQSWPRAFDRLQQAAEAGLETAQRQLTILSIRGAPDRDGDSSSGDWAAIRKSLSLERLLDTPSRQFLSDSPRIVAFSDFATAAECEWVKTKAQDRLQPAKVFHAKTGGQTQNPVRDNSAIEFQLPDMDIVLEVLRARIATATRLPVPIFEPTQVLHYAVGQQFRPHHDFLDPSASGFAEQLRLFGQRIATVLVYLSDDYIGGETVFPKLGISYRGGVGDALFWTNVDRQGNVDPMTMHAGTPPTAGEKWVISQWIRDRAAASPYSSGASPA
ncbi:MAG: 2OG-Fe(II) oxygenase [Pseudomonadota bacterium]|nr:2OG-Fe(II) oxygenase [Pseudomonadota bacterium]